MKWRKLSWGGVLFDSYAHPVTKSRKYLKWKETVKIKYFVRTSPHFFWVHRRQSEDCAACRLLRPIQVCLFTDSLSFHHAGCPWNQAVAGGHIELVRNEIQHWRRQRVRVNTVAGDAAACVNNIRWILSNFILTTSKPRPNIWSINRPKSARQAARAKFTRTDNKRQNSIQSKEKLHSFSSQWTHTRNTQTSYNEYG